MRKDIPNHEYHADKLALSRSKLLNMGVCPAYFYAKYDEHKEQTPQMALGSLVHTLFLEPHLFESDYIIEPEADGRTTEGKKIKGKFKEEFEEKKLVNPALTAIKVDSYDTAQRMVESLRKNPRVEEILQREHENEVSIFWEQPVVEYQIKHKRCSWCGEPFSGKPGDLGYFCTACESSFNPQSVLLKARPDIMGKDWLADVKTTRYETPAKFIQNMWVDGYDVQAYMQQVGAETLPEVETMETYYWFCVQSADPYLSWVVEQDEDDHQSGMEEFHRVLELYAQCRDQNWWPGYEDVYTGNGLDIRRWSRK